MRFSFLKMASIMAVTALLSIACTGEKKVVITADATDMTYYSATLNATCSIAKEKQGVAVFYYCTLDNVDSIKVKGKKVVVGTISESTKSFSKEISDLEPSTQYCCVAYLIIDNNEYYGSVKYFTTTSQENGHFLVDLGLSVKWATCNVGATKPEEYGDYYAWGETETKTDYSLSNYKWYNGKSYTKYTGSTNLVDRKSDLDPEDDVAHVIWGGRWRMPTNDEMSELLRCCIWTWYSSGNSEFNGVAGYKVTSDIEGYTDRYIFLPAAGCRSGSSLDYVGSNGYYWSVTGAYFNYNNATAFMFIPFEKANLLNFSRNSGLPVRPVCP